MEFTDSMGSFNLSAEPSDADEDSEAGWSLWFSESSRLEEEVCCCPHVHSLPLTFRAIAQVEELALSFSSCRLVRSAIAKWRAVIRLRYPHSPIHTA